METTESPLDVLSRAALMLQRNVLPPPSYDEARSMSQQKYLEVSSDCVPTTTVLSKNEVICSNSGKWKREKKYQHKSYSAACNSANSLKSSKFSPVPNNKCDSDTKLEPLDMSKRNIIKDRGDPPSYFQSILNSSYSRRNANISVVSSNCKSSVVSKNSESKETMCDQVVNEHFRRSLGGDYLSIFKSDKISNKEEKADEKSLNQNLIKTPDSIDSCTETKNLNRCTSPSPLSVDDHFAKALGDTWKKLQQQHKSQNQNKKSDGALYFSNEKVSQRR